MNSKSDSAILCHKVGINLAPEQIKLKKIKAKEQAKAPNKVEFVIEKSKPKNDIGINLNIVNCSSGEKNIRKRVKVKF